MGLIEHEWRRYDCADCDHTEVRYGGHPVLCVACGNGHSFVDAGPVAVVHPAALETVTKIAAGEFEGRAELRSLAHAALRAMGVDPATTRGR